MDWNTTLKSNVLKCGTKFELQIDFDEVVNNVKLYSYEGQPPVNIKLFPKVDGTGHYLLMGSKVMIPIPENTNVNSLKISWSDASWSLYGMYEIILEGDEIKSFPNGGALVVENIRINFNFE